APRAATLAQRGRAQPPIPTIPRACQFRRAFAKNILCCQAAARRKPAFPYQSVASAGGSNWFSLLEGGATHRRAHPPGRGRVGVRTGVLRWPALQRRCVARGARVASPNGRQIRLRADGSGSIISCECEVAHSSLAISPSKVQGGLWCQEADMAQEPDSLAFRF